MGDLLICMILLICIILASFQMLGMQLVVSERFKMFVRALMAYGHSCLRCR